MIGNLPWCFANIRSLCLVFKGKAGDTFSSQLLNGTNDGCSQITVVPCNPKTSWEPGLGSVFHWALCADFGSWWCQMQSLYFGRCSPRHFWQRLSQRATRLHACDVCWPHTVTAHNIHFMYLRKGVRSHPFLKCVGCQVLWDKSSSSVQLFMCSAVKLEFLQICRFCV